MMEKLSDGQLEWVQQNRDRRVSRRAPQPIGPFASDVVKEQACLPAWRRNLVAVLDEVAGAELLDHTTIVGVRNGVLKLHVVEPVLMYDLRLRWEQRLIEELQARLPESGIHAIRFVTGPTAPGSRSR